MKKLLALILVICTLALFAFSFTSCGNNEGGDQNADNNNGQDQNDNGENVDKADCSLGVHIDKDDNKYCDYCSEYVVVVIDFYVLNDLHGKFCDTGTQPGVDELGGYLKSMNESDDYTVFLSSGDTWQGTAESGLTKGNILTEWMNELGFVSMTLGNHEFDWGEDVIRNNLEISDFPFLAINVYDTTTGERADYCSPSVMVERGGIQIGIIGAIGDCYSSVSPDMVENVEFKVDYELTNLVMEESVRLREAGADLIVYSIHDGYGKSTSSDYLNSSLMSSYYDTDLSDGYVDLVFEAHTHQSYSFVDEYGVYHLQAAGENQAISHVEIEVNSANGNNHVNEEETIGNSVYSKYEKDEGTEAVENKYSNIIDFAYNQQLGRVSSYMNDGDVEDFVAQLYLEAGLEKWGSNYDIVLGGGFLKTRSPYSLTTGVKCYADIFSLLPFDNRLVLCSVLGSNLKSKFINTTNSDYHIALSEFGEDILSSISNSETYYIVVDTYTALYASNRLTIIEFFDDTTFARDLFADAIKAGRLDAFGGEYELTSIPEALKIGDNLAGGEATKEYFFIKGTVKSAPVGSYGNLYIVDENGKEIYVYGIYDRDGTRYDGMTVKPKAGDEIIVYSTIYKFVYGSTVTVELKNATLVEIVN